jgi:hypothetical protein
MSQLMRASRQWASRPNDERFWSVADLERTAVAARAASGERTYELRQLNARPEGEDIVITSPRGEARPTNWGFAQLCRVIGAPADYLTGLPAELACQNINFGFAGKADKVKLLCQNNQGSATIRAVTSDTYARFWDAEVCELLRPAIAAGWKVPPARPAPDCDPSTCRVATDADIIPGMRGGAQVQVGETIAPSGVYRGDRDSFIFLVNPTQDVDDGNGGGGLFKGLIASNSEVGKASIRIQSFCHEGVCGNHIIWGATDVMELKRKHYGDLRPFLRKLQSWLISWTASDTAKTTAMIAAAKRYVLGQDKEEVEERVKKLGLAALTLKAIRASWDYAEQWEHTAHATPNTAWGFVHGLTRFSQTMPWTDQRFALDLAGGKILNLAV